MGKNEEDFKSSILFEAQKYFCVSEFRFNFFSNGHIPNVASTFPNVGKIDIENDNVTSTLSIVVQFNVEMNINLYRTNKYYYKGLEQNVFSNVPNAITTNYL